LDCLDFFASFFHQGKNEEEKENNIGHYWQIAAPVNLGLYREAT
jgi:hypothetical protein